MRIFDVLGLPIVTAIVLGQSAPVGLGFDEQDESWKTRIKVIAAPPEDDSKRGKPLDPSVVAERVWIFGEEELGSDPGTYIGKGLSLQIFAVCQLTEPLRPDDQGVFRMPPRALPYAIAVSTGAHFGHCMVRARADELEVPVTPSVFRTLAVKDLDGQPLPHVPVALFRHNKGGEKRHDADTGADGEATFLLTREQWSVGDRWTAGFGELLGGKRIPVDHLPGSMPIQLALPPHCSLRVKLPWSADLDARDVHVKIAFGVNEEGKDRHRQWPVRTHIEGDTLVIPYLRLSPALTLRVYLPGVVFPLIKEWRGDPVAPGECLELELEPRKHAQVVTRLVDQERKPIAGRKVNLRHLFGEDMKERAQYSSVTSDEQGMVVFRIALGIKRPSKTLTIAVGNTQDREVEIDPDDLTAGARIHLGDTIVFD